MDYLLCSVICPSMEFNLIDEYQLYMESEMEYYAGLAEYGMEHGEDDCFEDE